MRKAIDSRVGWALFTPDNQRWWFSDWPDDDRSAVVEAFERWTSDDS